MELILWHMAKGYLPYDIDQRLLLPLDMREWLPEGHLALFILDVVGELDLSKIYAVYDAKDTRGRAGYHPVMMVALLLYAYCVGKPSSRRIERATHEDVAFRVLAGNQHPDHDSIADFRKRHLKALSGLFMQVLQLCQQAGLVKLGHIAIDGTKVKANASKHKAMSYERMSETEKKLQEEVDRLLAEAERVDAEEDAQHGKGKRGDELPNELKRREDRLVKIREAKAALEREAKEKAEAKAAEVAEKLAERAREEAETGNKARGPEPKAPDPEQAAPEPKAQRNFTDPESRIMPDGANKGAFIQGYNAQIAVDGEAQIIVAALVTQTPNDVQQLVPMAPRSWRTSDSSQKRRRQTPATSAPTMSTILRLRIRICSCRPIDRSTEASPSWHRSRTTPQPRSACDTSSRTKRTARSTSNEKRSSSPCSARSKRRVDCGDFCCAGSKPFAPSSTSSP